MTKRGLAPAGPGPVPRPRPPAPGPTRQAAPSQVPAPDPRMPENPEALDEFPARSTRGRDPHWARHPPGRPSLTRNPRAARSARANSLRACALPPPRLAPKCPAKRGSGSQPREGGAGSGKTRNRYRCITKAGRGESGIQGSGRQKIRAESRVPSPAFSAGKREPWRKVASAARVCCPHLRPPPPPDQAPQIGS